MKIIEIIDSNLKLLGKNQSKLWIFFNLQLQIDGITKKIESRSFAKGNQIFIYFYFPLEQRMPYSLESHKLFSEHFLNTAPNVPTKQAYFSSISPG